MALVRPLQRCREAGQLTPFLAGHDAGAHAAHDWTSAWLV